MIQRSSMCTMGTATAAMVRTMTAAMTASMNLAEQSRDDHKRSADGRTNYVNLAGYRKHQRYSAPSKD
jgi:CHASE1-domain containing sensor protein